MPRQPKDGLLALVQSFFQDYLRGIRGASDHTIRAYRDALKLFFLFLASRERRSVAELNLNDIRAESVLGFLDHVESQRGNSAASRNCRLAAIRSFVQHLLRHDIARADQYGRILAIASKRATIRVINYLEPEEARAVIAGVDAQTPHAARDLALLLLLYNTGARVSEILALRRRDIQGHSTCLLLLHGKGRKQRTVPLWKGTSTQLKRWLAEQPDAPETPLFTSRSGQPLSRFGLAKRLALAVETAAIKCPTLLERTISPHTFRHSTAMHLLQAGVDITVIALLLGHENPATTHQYIELDLKMKERCLSQLRTPGTSLPRFKPTDRLLAFLENL